MSPFSVWFTVGWVFAKYFEKYLLSLLLIAGFVLVFSTDNGCAWRTSKENWHETPSRQLIWRKQIKKRGI